jgi:hypothetical protein
MIKIPNGELGILYANCICASFCLNWLESTVRSGAFPFVIKALYIERRETSNNLLCSLGSEYSWNDRLYYLRICRKENKKGF